MKTPYTCLSCGAQRVTKQADGGLKCSACGHVPPFTPGTDEANLRSRRRGTQEAALKSRNLPVSLPRLKFLDD